ncbi:hypothetical protein [Cryptosporangium sp. NPDC048952]|uniref:hypothetical protein n=1 Tax=Cryptosporangium sp. NPDC048952 TaxID=3363961 RepID=UPI003717CE9F
MADLWLPSAPELWLPPGVAGIESSWTVLGKPYCTAEEIFGEAMDSATRYQLWGRIPIGHALSLLSSMLRDLDLQALGIPAIEAGWAAALADHARTQALAAIRQGRRLLPPQLLVVAVKEALRYCPAGASRDDLSDLGLVLQAVWSIGDEVGHVLDEDAPTWGGLPASLAAEMMANQYFNVTARPLPLIARTQAMWRDGWGLSVDPGLVSRAGGTPAELFLEATGCELDAFLGVAIHLWVQAQEHRYLRFPPEFFSRIGIAEEAVERFLGAASASLSELQLYASGQDAVHRPWDFNRLREKPLVRLPDGSVQVIRLGFVLERAFGQVPEFDVGQHLRRIDGSGSLAAAGGRAEAFRFALNTQFEDCVARTLRRIFPATGHFERVYAEHAMRRAWRTKRHIPKVCDWAVDCGDVWLCFDATNRRLAQPVAGGFASLTDLDAEVEAVLAGRKASQIASTIQHLTTRLPQLTGRNLPAGTRFVPLIVIPDDGLPWNPAVHNRVQGLLAAAETLQSKRAAPLGVITFEDLGLLERVVEDGQDAGGLLWGWRSQRPEMPLQHFLNVQGVPLRRPEWEVEAFHRLADELTDRITSQGA